MRNSYEHIKAKKSLKYIILIAALSHVFSLLFFTLVGRLDREEADTMFINKLKALVYRYMYVYILELCLINLVYVFAVNNIDALLSPLAIFDNILSIIFTVIMSALISLTVLLLSIMFGLRFQSTNSSLITSIILIAIVGNAVATSYLLPNSIILLISMGIIFIDYISTKYLISSIRNDDVME